MLSFITDLWTPQNVALMIFDPQSKNSSRTPGCTQQVLAWWGFTKYATDRQRIEAFLRRAVRTGFYSPDGPMVAELVCDCLLYTSPSPRDGLLSRMPSSA